jgi:hypothetical protein
LLTAFFQRVAGVHPDTNARSLPTERQKKSRHKTLFAPWRSVRGMLTGS